MDDLNQAARTIMWLEEERRKDKAALIALQERVHGLIDELTEQSRRIQALQSALSATQIALSKMTQYEKMIEQLRTDVVGEMDRREDAQQKAIRESDRLRKVESEQVGRQIAEIRKELPRFKPLEDELPMRRAEERRLAELVARVSQRVDDLAVRTEDRIQVVSYLEEGRRQDAKRIVQLEEFTTSVAKRIDPIIAKQVLLEENLQRLPPRIDEVAKKLLVVDKPVEEVRLAQFRLSQEMRAFTEEVNKAIAPIPDHIAGYQRVQEVAMTNQRSLEEIRVFEARIETRQAELTEKQRMAEDRAKKILDEWLTEQEKRWQRQTLALAEQRQEHDRVHQPIETRLEELEETVSTHPPQFKAIWDTVEEMAKVHIIVARQVAEGQQAALEKGRPSKPAMAAADRAAVAKRP